MLARRSAVLIDAHKERLAQRLKRVVVQRKVWLRWMAFTALARRIRGWVGGSAALAQAAAAAGPSG